MHAGASVPARPARYSTASACSAKETSITAAGWPSAAARLTTRPRPAGSAACRRRASYWATSGRTCWTSAGARPAARRGRSRRRSDRRWRARRRPSYLEVLARQHPPRAGHRHEDVAARGRLGAGSTSKPCIRASSARSGSTSQTITCAPAPRARWATPRAAGAVAEHARPSARPAARSRRGGSRPAPTGRAVRRRNARSVVRLVRRPAPGSAAARPLQRA